MKPESILFLDHAPTLGGAERSLLLLLKHLDRTCWRPHLACTGDPLAEEVIALGVPVHILPMPRLRRSPRFLRDWLTRAHAIAHLARQTGAALLHANTVRAALYAAPAAGQDPGPSQTGLRHSPRPLAAHRPKSESMAIATRYQNEQR
jgi:hypothetical protein